ncbi:MAG TPA: L,D-transpeptidase family protein [Sphingomicrobium sp.]|nr:L,D-transpeptidase family protein [Sphingomicrobium sp.]
MNARNKSLLGLAALSLLATTAPAAQPLAPLPAASATLPAAGAVSAFYSRWRAAPIWFQGPVARPAARQLAGILRRAPLDGLASGPQLAAEVEAAIARAASGNPAAVAAAEQTLSAAWVMYVQAVKRPTTGMYYASPVLAPQGSRPDLVLLAAAKAPSLEAHLTAVSNVNPLYAQIRDTAWAEAQASGNATLDPRVLANLDRARSIPGTGRFVVVDSAGQRMTMFENGRAVDSMKVIVGTSEFATPMIASYIHYITLNPYWDSPDHLVRRNIAPKVVSEGLGYLKARGYEVMADWTETSAVIPPEKIDWKAVAAGKTQIRIRQKPGPDNFMATMKIPFQNKDDIYLHDTPAKALFAKSQRALSNGCVRLEDAPRFARWLLGGRDAVTSSKEPEQHLQLAVGVPIYLTYLTAQPENGKINYVADVYGWDQAATQRLAAR